MGVWGLTAAYLLFGILTDNVKARVEMPTPEAIMGALLGPEIGWPASTTGTSTNNNGDKCLRHTDAHLEFLFHFTKVCVPYETFKMDSKTQLLSQYLSAGLESFLVMTYDNSYNKWMWECIRDRGEEPGSTETTPEEGSEQLSSVTNSSVIDDAAAIPNIQTNLPAQTNRASPVSPLPSPNEKYTNGALGKGKYKGWNDEGMLLYRHIATLLKEQRRDGSLGTAFEIKLLDKFKGTGEGRRGKRARPQFDEIDEFFPSQEQAARAENDNPFWEPV